MQFVQMFAARRGKFLTGAVILIVLVSAVTASLLPSRDDGFDPAAPLEFYELAGMFGASKLQYGFLDIAIEQNPASGAKDGIQEMMTELRDRIVASGVDTDFDAPPPPTGDELFDTYAQAVADRLDVPAAGNKPDHYDPALVPDSELAKWEDRFGEDPRYWELRYLLKKQAVESKAADTVKTANRLEALAFLEESRSRGIATANTMLLLYLEQRVTSQESLEELTTYESAKSIHSSRNATFELPDRPEISAADIETAARIHAANDLLESELLEAAVALAKDEAWPHYLRGIHRMSVGEYGAGLRDLQAGNVAPLNSYPRPFPLAFVADSLGTPTPAGGPIVAGAIHLILIPYPQPDYTELKDHVREAAIAAELGLGPEVYDAWHKFTCRFTAAWPDSLVQSLSASMMAGLLREEYLANHEANLADAQIATLHRINGIRAKLKLKYRATTDFDWMTSSMVLTGAFGHRGMALGQFLQSDLEAKASKQELIPIYRQLAEISYPELVTPESLLDVEILSDELQLNRREIRKRSQDINDVINSACARVRSRLSRSGAAAEAGTAD